MVKLHNEILRKITRIVEIGQSITDLTNESRDLRREIVGLCKEAGLGEPTCTYNTKGEPQHKNIEFIHEDVVIEIIKGEDKDYTVLTKKLPMLDGKMK